MVKKFALAFLIAALMLIALVPVMVFADGGSLKVAGIMVKGDNDNVLGDGKVTYVSQTNTLTLKDGAEINVLSGSCIISSGIDLNIIVEGTVTLQTGKSYKAISVTDGSLTIKGNDANSSLTICQAGEGIYYDKGDILIDGCNLKIASQDWGISQERVHSDDEELKYSGNITIQNCKSVEIISQEKNAICTDGVRATSAHENNYRQGGNVVFKDCDKVALSNVESESYETLFAAGGVSITNCDEVDINSDKNSGIHTKFGDVLIDNCKELSIKANDTGIYQENTNSDVAVDELGYMCNVKITGCDSVELTTQNYNNIFAGGVYATSANGYKYRFGGNILFEDCKTVVMDAEKASGDAIYATGGVSIVNSNSVDIVSGEKGISARYGDILIEQCIESFKISATKDGIYKNTVESDSDELDFSGNITIQGCGKLDLSSKQGYTIFANGIKATYLNDYKYRFGGNITIDECAEVVLDSTGSACDVIYAQGGVKLTDCSNVDIQSDQNGIVSNYGEVLVDTCSGITINASLSGIYQGRMYTDVDAGELGYTCGVTIRYCDNVEIDTENQYGIFAGGVWKEKTKAYRLGGNVSIKENDNVVLNCAGKKSDAIYAYGGINIENCPGVLTSGNDIGTESKSGVDINAGNTGISAHNGKVIISKCPDVDIDAGSNGIYSLNGEIVIDSCDDLMINSASAGINQAGIVTDDDLEYTFGVTIRKCGNIDITTTANSCISVDAVLDSYRDYRMGGLLTIEGCTKVALDNSASDYDAISAYGGINISNCPDVDIEAGKIGICASAGDVIFDNCTNLSIAAADSSIYKNFIVSDENEEALGFSANVIIKNSGTVDLASGQGNVIYADSVLDSEWDYSFGGNIIFENCTDVTISNVLNEVSGYDAMFAWGGVNFTKCPKVTINSKGDGISAQDGEVRISECDTVNINSETTGICSKSASIEDSDIDLVCGELQVRPESINSEIEVDSDLSASISGTSQTQKAVDTSEGLTLTKGSKLSANASVLVKGDLYVDSSKVFIAALTGHGLLVGGYGDKEDVSTYYGKLVVGNGSSLIANTQNNDGTAYAIYAYNGIDISNSEFYANTASGAAIGCPGKDKINFNGWLLYGDTQSVDYDSRSTVKTRVSFGYHEGLKVYTALIDEDAAMTIYTDVDFVHEHIWEYEADGATLTAKCVGPGTCDSDANTSLTILAPAHNYYKDSFASEATLKDDTTSIGDLEISAADIKYYEGEEELTGAPVDPGSYEARIKVKNPDDSYVIAVCAYIITGDLCKYRVSLEEGENLTLFIDGNEINGCTVIKVSGGYIISRNEKYLAPASDGKAIAEQDESYTWKYDGGLYVEDKIFKKTGFWPWTRTTVKMIRYYMNHDGNQFELTKRKITVYVQKTAMEHSWKYFHDGDGKHEAYCTRCQHKEKPVDHDYSYDEKNHKCICGKVDPACGRVTGLKVTEKKFSSRSGWFWWCKKTTKYRYTITVKTENVSVSKVKCSVDGKSGWRGGCSFTNHKKLERFYIRVTDSNGKVTDWLYEDNKVTEIKTL